MYPNQDPNAQLLAQIAGAGEGNDYADRFIAGEHIVALNNCEIKLTQEHGNIVSVDFVVMESSVAGYAGKPSGEGYFIQKPDTQGGKGARQRAFSLAKAIVQSLGGDPDNQELVIDPQTGRPALLPNGQPLTKGVALVQNTLGELTRADQPWRGVMLRASASKGTGKNTGKEYTKVRYSPINQTAEQIGNARRRIEASTPAPSQVAPPVQYSAPPAAQGYAAPPNTMTAPPIQGYPQAAPPVQFQQAAPPVQFQQAPAAAAPAAPAGAPLGGSLLGR